MFVGAINQDTRAILYEMAQSWQGKEVYVGCSGNFTVERVLNKAGIMSIHSNDVSLYSCCIGRYLTGQAIKVEIADKRFEWLNKYMKDDISIISTILLCSEMFKYIDREEQYHKRMYKAYSDKFEKLHNRTIDRISDTLDKLKIKEFYAGDVIDFIRKAPEDIVAISFPPTYKSGYERLYKKIDEVFRWDMPEYEIFDDDSFEEFTKQLISKEQWVTLRDKRVDDLEKYLCSITKTGMRSKAVYLYSNCDISKLTLARQKIEKITIPRFTEKDIISKSSKLSVISITQGQMNLLRSEYLSVGIIPAPAMLNLAVLIDGKIIGAIAFQRSRFTARDAYMMTDFAIRPTKYKRLSKLILASAISKEVKILIEQSIGERIEVISTTAFTDKPVSMKYRGIFDLYSRKEGMLNYTAPAGQWTLQEGLDWWLKKHAKK